MDIRPHPDRINKVRITTDNEDEYWNILGNLSFYNLTGNVELLKLHGVRLGVLHERGYPRDFTLSYRELGHLAANALESDIDLAQMIVSFFMESRAIADNRNELSETLEPPQTRPIS